MAISGEDSSRSALVLYGTETGNAQDIAEDLGRLLERLRFSSHVCELDAVKPDSLHRNLIVFFVVSTTGQGDIPVNARTLWRLLLLRRLPGNYLVGVNFVTFGLGNSSYPKFNWAARKLRKRLLQLGATEAYPHGEGDEQHGEGHDGTFIPWAVELRKWLLSAYSLPPGQDPIPDDVRLPPKWELGLDDETSDLATPTAEPSLDRGLDRLNHDTRPLPGTISARLELNERLTPQNHWQDVRHMALITAETLPYMPGDILHVMPRNFEQDVEALMALMRWNDVADKPLKFVPGSGYRDSDARVPPPPIPFLQNHRFTLRQLLVDYLDIMSIPRRSFFATLSYFTNDSFQKERLQEFTNPEYLDELYDYTSRPRRSILEVLQEFDTVHIPWQSVIDVFPLLRSRQFSLASGGALKAAAHGGTRFDLLVAIVRYQTVIKRIRQGVCTRYLSVLVPGSTMKVKLERGGLNTSPSQLSLPSVFIGPGTGLAPLRSMLWEKAAMAALRQTCPGKDAPPSCSPPIGPIILVFGGRNREADNFFAEEWEQLGVVLDLVVFTAFSRDQPQKVYVQDKIREHAGRFYKILIEMGGSVYICGSSGRMPQAVREALIECFQMETARIGGREWAEEYLLQMERDGRYKQETW